MNISLNKHFDAFVARAVESGRFKSSSEVVREALRLLEERELKLDALRADVARGRADRDEGRVTSFDSADIKAAGRQSFANR